MLRDSGLLGGTRSEIAADPRVLKHHNTRRQDERGELISATQGEN